MTSSNCGASTRSPHIARSLELLQDQGLGMKPVDRAMRLVGRTVPRSHAQLPHAMWEEIAVLGISTCKSVAAPVRSTCRTGRWMRIHRPRCGVAFVVVDCLSSRHRQARRPLRGGPPDSGLEHTAAASGGDGACSTVPTNRAGDTVKNILLHSYLRHLSESGLSLRFLSLGSCLIASPTSRCSQVNSHLWTRALCHPSATVHEK